MEQVKSPTLYVGSKNHIKNSGKSKVPSNVFKQELVTWEYTDSGIKKTTIVRNFNSEEHIDSYFSEPIAFQKNK